tara:strand:- start:304 stop:1398 length:1095 start_codon:yes stop_codon:yes gene_type:complete
MTKARDLADLGNKTSLDEINDAYNAGALSNRNLIINGAMQVAQRATTFNYNMNVANIYTTCDRFSLLKSSGTYNLTNTQSTDAPAGFSHSYKVVCDTAYTPSASDNFGINQNIEISSGLQGFGFGTSEAKDITFSFYVKGTPKTYTFQTNYVGTDGEQKSQNKAFTVTNTWTRKVITFSAGGTSTSIGIEPDQTSTGMNFRIWLAAGPDDIASEITTWTANPPPTYEAATGQGNFFSATGNEFYLTGVQLELGDTATPFEHRSYGDELAKCQRYYETGKTGASAYGASGTGFLGSMVDYKVEKRAAATLTQASQSYNQIDSNNIFLGNVGLTIPCNETNGFHHCAIHGNVNAKYAFTYTADAEL